MDCLLMFFVMFLRFCEFLRRLTIYKIILYIQLLHIRWIFWSMHSKLLSVASQASVTTGAPPKVPWCEGALTGGRVAVKTPTSVAVALVARKKSDLDQTTLGAEGFYPKTDTSQA